MDHVDAGHHLEQLARDMLRRAVDGGGEIYPAGVRPGVGVELRHRFHRNGRMHLKTALRSIDAGAPFAEGYQSSSKPMAIGKALRVQSWLLCGG
jgi:hypothetical protein